MYMYIWSTGDFLAIIHDYTQVVLMASIPGSISERPDLFVTGVPTCSVLQKSSSSIKPINIYIYIYILTWIHGQV